MSGGQWMLLCGLCAFLIIGVDLWVRLFRGEEPMLSLYIRRLNQWWPMCGVAFGLVLGSLLGHFFWCDCGPPAPPVFQAPEDQPLLRSICVNPEEANK